MSTPTGKPELPEQERPNRSPESQDPSKNGSSSESDDLRPTRQLSLGKKLAFLAFISILLFLACESLLILAGISFPLLYQPDEHFATRLKNHLNVRYCEEGNAIVRTNSAGFRDQERQKRKPDGVFRIAVIGDSFCEAIQVARDKTFSCQVQRLLEEQGYATEVLNFGISGFGTAQAFELLRYEVLDYQPDLVILGFFPGNDISDNSRALNPGQIKPYYDLVDGELQLDDSFRTDERFLAAQSWATQTKSSLINASRCLQIVNKLYSRWRSPVRRAANIGIGLEPKLYQPPQDKQWLAAWAVTEALLWEIGERCKKKGVECLVLAVSNPIQVHPDRAVRERFQTKNQIQSLFYPHDRLLGFCEASQIPILSVARKFAKEAADSDPPIYFHGFANTEMGTGHWNELGHRRAAEHLTEYLVGHVFKAK